MVIASIDIQGGKVVQLKGGKEKILERSDAAALARDFNLYGELALIDIDGATGSGSNDALLRSILPLAQCRVGGGIRSAERAAELLSLGAEKIIIGSKAFRLPDGGFGLNLPFLREIVEKIGRERLIIAIDSRDGLISVDGWKTDTGLPLIETAKKLEDFAGGFLWTCIEREGAMAGAGIKEARELRAALSASLTVAGGVSTLEEIEELARLGCDVQLGMALYTGKISLKEAFSVSLNWEKAVGDAPKLLPVIAQSITGEVLMTAWTDSTAIKESFSRGNLCFFSRTRQKLWMKGETSGNTLKLLRLRADCDRDALLATVRPRGPVCHTGAWSCFETGRPYSFQLLQEIIEERLNTAPEGSYTASLSLEKIKRKIMEEAFELCTAESREGLIWEAADLFFHALLLISKEKIGLSEVLGELQRRHKEEHGKKKRFSAASESKNGGAE